MAEPRSFLVFASPDVGERQKKKQGFGSQEHPTSQEQGRRLTPQFRIVQNAFEQRRMRLVDTPTSETDPALVIVFELKDSIADFYKAVENIEGLEFLNEFLDPSTIEELKEGQTDLNDTDSTKQTSNRLYLLMSNKAALDRLLSLFTTWTTNPAAKLPQGLGRLKELFAQLRAVRPWGPEDRIRESGILATWQQELKDAGPWPQHLRVEIELWYHTEPALRDQAEARVRELIHEINGKICAQADIQEIQYHALLVEIPIQTVEQVLAQQWEDIRLLHCDAIMYFSPHYPMTVITDQDSDDDELFKTYSYNREVRTEPHLISPRIALFDGLPVENHHALANRLIVDDVDNYAAGYPIPYRQHGTSMASLIIHGDLSQDGQPIDRPLYVRPILKPPSPETSFEQGDTDRLVVDLIHQAVRRLFEKDGNQDPVAPTIRIINLSYGIPMRAFSRRMSPLGNLLDWLASTYNVLFVVSAGNYPSPEAHHIPREEVSDVSRPLFEQRFGSGTLLKTVLSPGDAMNALTVGAIQNDDGTQLPIDQVDTTFLDGPALYGATGPGVNRSIKPDVYYPGGRERARTEDPAPGDPHIRIATLIDLAHPPGIQAAAPSPEPGRLDGVAFTYGTSQATALVTRLADRLYQDLEDTHDLLNDQGFPDPRYFPLLVRALIVHTAHRSSWPKPFTKAFTSLPGRTKKHLTTLFGYGPIDEERFELSSGNRAIVLAGNEIAEDRAHTYYLPLPPSLDGRTEWHRITITLAYFAPTNRRYVSQYKGARLKVSIPDTKGPWQADGTDSSVTTRGTIQQITYANKRAISCPEGTTLPITVTRMPNHGWAGHQPLPYALTASIETKVETSTTIYDEVRQRLHTEPVKPRTRQTWVQPRG